MLLLDLRGTAAGAHCRDEIAVVRGETYHFEIVANESARGLMDVALDCGLPIANGILTYTPNPNANGTDSLDYTVSYLGKVSNVATMSINIMPVNDVPVAGNVTSGAVVAKIRQTKRLTKHEVDFLKGNAPGDIKMTLPTLISWADRRRRIGSAALIAAGALLLANLVERAEAPLAVVPH